MFFAGRIETNSLIQTSAAFVILVSIRRTSAAYSTSEVNKVRSFPKSFYFPQ